MIFHMQKYATETMHYNNQSNNTFENKEMFLTVFIPLLIVLLSLIFRHHSGFQVFRRAFFVFCISMRQKLLLWSMLIAHYSFNDFIHMNKSKFGTNAIRYEKYSLEFLAKWRKNFPIGMGKMCAFMLTPHLTYNIHILLVFILRIAHCACDRQNKEKAMQRINHILINIYGMQFMLHVLRLFYIEWLQIKWEHNLYLQNEWNVVCNHTSKCSWSDRNGVVMSSMPCCRHRATITIMQF